MTLAEKRHYTGWDTELNRTRCTRGDSRCSWEVVGLCYACTTPTMEHLDEDGYAFLVEPYPDEDRLTEAMEHTAMRTSGQGSLSWRSIAYLVSRTYRDLSAKAAKARAK